MLVLFWRFDAIKCNFITEVRSSIGQDPQQRMEIIAAHFLLIGKDYLKEEIYFPLRKTFYVVIFTLFDRRF